MAIGQNRSRKSAQWDRWSFCPTAGTVWSAEVKNVFLPAISFVEFLIRERLVSRRTGTINQIRAFLLERGVAVRQGLRFLRAEIPRILAMPNHVLSPRIVRIIQGLAEDWHRLGIDHLSDEIAALARQDAGCERQCVLETPRLRRPARRPLPKFESWAPLENAAVSGTAISVRCAVRSPAPTESKTCWGWCIVSVAM